MTPLQKLIKQFEEIKDSNLESSIDVGFAISLAKSLLDEEKELLIETFYDGYPSVSNAEIFYKELSNTKDNG